MSWLSPLESDDVAPRTTAPTQQSFVMHHGAAHACVGAAGRRVVWIQQEGTDEPAWLESLEDGEPAVPSPILHLGRGIESLSQGAEGIGRISLMSMILPPASFVTLVAFDEASGRVSFVDEFGVVVVLEF